ncbi:MAG: hypothetical protein JRG90_12975 [Deltaproteobacteria bacterium]|nr:hypothetical protein [Deltaproteobacteria bacterium]
MTQPAEKSYTQQMDLEALADVTLKDADANAHRLGDYWRDRNVALVFLRHFG